MTNLENVREAILSLTYSEMLSLAQWFADVDKDGDAPINDPHFWAEVINSWAENADLAEGVE